MEYENEKKQHKWSLDRHVPIAIVMAIALQTGVWIWWAASFSTATELRLTQAERKLDAMNGLNERMAGLEARLSTTNDILIDIREQLKDERNRNSRGG